MLECWHLAPDHRPTFKMCVQEIESLLDAEAGLSEISGYTIRRGHEFPATPTQPLSTSLSQGMVSILWKVVARAKGRSRQASRRAIAPLDGVAFP